MNNVGVSTASLYPLHIEDAFRELALLNIKHAEYFANSLSESGDPYASDVINMQKEYDITISSFHPFTSPMEPLFLFSGYDRRVEEMIKLYKYFFGTMNKLGAKIFVLHGATLQRPCEESYYFKQFRMLAEAGREYGITVAQENVYYCMSGKLDFLVKMKRELGDYAAFVLDLKQVRRSGENPFDYVGKLENSIVHCHVSDGNPDSDCLPIGNGCFDFESFLALMAWKDYKGSYIIELYRNNYRNFSELKLSADRFSEILEDI